MGDQKKKKGKPPKKAGASETPLAHPEPAVPAMPAVSPDTPAAVFGEGALNNPSPGQCIVWRTGEFHERVRRAVAEWAQEPASSILPTNTLGELAKGTPWNIGQQARLVQAVNANQIFAPPFSDTHMAPPTQLLPASTTVEQWEKVVWRQQTPLTPCFPFTD
jgi:hypothetical protein